jgi:hypothetical protein
MSVTGEFQALKKLGVTDGITRLRGALRNGFARKGASAQVVELRSRPVGG